MNTFEFTFNDHGDLAAFVPLAISSQESNISRCTYCGDAAAPD